MTNENNYRSLVIKVYMEGKDMPGRNGDTKELFGESLKLNVSNNKFPMITGRKMWSRGIIGEFLALIQTECKHLNDFESRGCNYWKLWADKDGNLDLDYPPGNQLDDIIDNITQDPHSRRHIINLWNSDRIGQLSLPCCHYSYQFNVQGDSLNMIWTQRSADLMIGVPADMLLATLYLRIVAQATGYKANDITMNFGSTHIYKSHLKNASEYISRKHYRLPTLEIADLPYKYLTQKSFTVLNYEHQGKLSFDLKA